LLGFALAREAQQVLRNDLRLLIMSATLDTDELRLVLKNPPLINSKGRQYPVTYRYQEPDGSSQIAQNTCRLILKAMREEQEGDVLVFLPGSGDILPSATFRTTNNNVPCFPILQEEERSSLRLPSPKPVSLSRVSGW
jgi:ATP-dependent helicase HrpB